jgi:DNA-binding Lrp family transcriptional regulator
VDDSRSWRIHRLNAAQEDALRQVAAVDHRKAVGSAEELSDVERGVAHLLAINGRASAAEIARKLSLNRSTAYRLTQSLLDRGVTRPRVQVEPELLGYSITALISLAVLSGRIPEALKKLSVQRSARFVAMTCGTYSLLYHGNFLDKSDLSNFLLDDIGSMPGSPASTSPRHSGW